MEIPNRVFDLLFKLEGRDIYVFLYLLKHTYPILEPDGNTPFLVITNREFEHGLDRSRSEGKCDEGCSLSKPSIQQVLSKLRKRGYIESKICNSDYRKRAYRFTPEIVEILMR